MWNIKIMIWFKKDLSSTSFVKSRIKNNFPVINIIQESHDGDIIAQLWIWENIFKVRKTTNTSKANRYDRISLENPNILPHYYWSEGCFLFYRWEYTEYFLFDSSSAFKIGVMMWKSMYIDGNKKKFVSELKKDLYRLLEHNFIMWTKNFYNEIIKLTSSIHVYGSVLTDVTPENIYFRNDEFRMYDEGWIRENYFSWYAEFKILKYIWKENMMSYLNGVRTIKPDYEIDRRGIYLWWILYKLYKYEQWIE